MKTLGKLGSQNQKAEPKNHSAELFFLKALE